MSSQPLLVTATTLLGLAAVGGWSVAWHQRRQCEQRVDHLEARLNHGAVFDETTGLLNRAGVSLMAGHVVSIARRDSDAVAGCLIRILPPSGRGHRDEEDVIAVAEASQLVFRSGDVVGRVAPDAILVVGKGPGFRTATVESRLVAQMVAMAPPGVALPGLLVSVSVLHPWDDGALPELEQRLSEDMRVRLAVHGLEEPA